MKQIALLCFLSIFVNTYAQQSVSATKNTSGDLVGIANKASFDQAPYKSWFDARYNSYTPDAKAIKKLKKSLKGLQIKAFMGTWCGDSKRETPRFYKVLEAAKFDLNNVEMITVNRRKQTPDHLEKGLNIRRVPTFIFYKDGKEVGRYVEYPRESMEKDFLKITTEEAYKHSYEN